MEKKLESKELENLSFKTLDCLTKYEEILDFTKIHGSSDIVELKSELEIINNQFNNALKRLDELDYDFIETIDKHSYEMLQKNYEEFTLLHEKLKNDLKLIENELNLSKAEYDNIIRECDDLKTNLETNKRSLTPRPEWKKCCQILQGREITWENFSLNKSSDQLLDLLINEFLGTYSKPNEDGFCLDMLPTIKPVPDYFIVSLTGLSKDLESNQIMIVKNRRLNRRELGICITELWNAKLSRYFEKNESTEKMSDFVFDYFLDKFKSKDIAIEWTVNLKESCTRFFKYERAAFLLDVLNQKKDEDIMFHLYSKIRKISMNFSSKSCYDDLKSRLIKNLTLKGLEKINLLFESVRKQLNTGKFSFEDLLDENDQTLMNFLSILNDQINEEKMLYISDILDNIKINSNEISIYDFIECIKKVDPSIEEKDLKKYCDWIFNKKSKFYLVDKDEFIEKLHDGNFFSHSNF